jgi:acetyl-CoA C-acetyltransferase
VTARVAVVGVGQTKYAAKRQDVSMPGLLREAAKRALDDAGMTWSDIDAVVIGKAPDMFEGVMMPELFLADALGAVGKPMLRVHTAGSVGGSTGVMASHLVSSGAHKRVLVVCFQKQSESNATWALSIRLPFTGGSVTGAGGYFAPVIRAYMRRANAPDHIGIKVAVKDRLNALKNPYAHLHLPDISEDTVRESPMLWDPIRYLETCPSSDGACAVVLADEQTAAAAPNPIAGGQGRGRRSEPDAGRDCAKDVYAQAGVTDPRRDIDCAEIYVPFSWYEPMWMENLGFAEEGAGWKMVDDGATALDGDMPVNMSGGVLSSNPIGASGLIRFAEAAQQVRGLAGEHQVDGARRALGHAYGGGAQFFAMWIVGSEKP